MVIIDKYLAFLPLQKKYLNIIGGEETMGVFAMTFSIFFKSPQLHPGCWPRLWFSSAAVPRILSGSRSAAPQGLQKPPAMAPPSAPTNLGFHGGFHGIPWDSMIFLGFKPMIMRVGLKGIYTQIDGNSRGEEDEQVQNMALPQKTTLETTSSSEYDDQTASSFWIWFPNKPSLAAEAPHPMGLSHQKMQYTWVHKKNTVDQHIYWIAINWSIPYFWANPHKTNQEPLKPPSTSNQRCPSSHPWRERYSWLHSFPRNDWADAAHWGRGRYQSWQPKLPLSWPSRYHTSANIIGFASWILDSFLQFLSLVSISALEFLFKFFFSATKIFSRFPPGRPVHPFTVSVSFVVIVSSPM